MKLLLIALAIVFTGVCGIAVYSLIDRNDKAIIIQNLNKSCIQKDSIITNYNKKFDAIKINNDKIYKIILEERELLK